MASIPSPQDPDKLIFAPAGAEAHAQAEQFTRGSLHRRDLDPGSPIRQFHAWFSAAQAASSVGGIHAVAHPETCTLATAELPSGRISARTVYLKELDAHGSFVVYTNLGTSRKAADLFGGGHGGGGGGGPGNPHAALVFWWEALQRQVRVEGRASRLSPEESQAYFDTRVRGSRLGAWASRQSEVLRPVTSDEGHGSSVQQQQQTGESSEEKDGDDGRARLEERVREAEKRFEGVERIPVPAHWGGLRIVPDRVEFWQGRECRLHDRFVYERASGEEDKWELMRLSP